MRVRKKRICFTGRLWLSLRSGKGRRGVRAPSAGIRPQRTRPRAGILGRIRSGTSATAAVRFGLTWMPRLPWRSLTNRTWPDRQNQLIRAVRPAFHDAVREALRLGSCRF